VAGETGPGWGFRQAPRSCRLHTPPTTRRTPRTDPTRASAIGISWERPSRTASASPSENATSLALASGRRPDRRGCSRSSVPLRTALASGGRPFEASSAIGQGSIPDYRRSCWFKIVTTPMLSRRICNEGDFSGVACANDGECPGGRCCRAAVCAFFCGGGVTDGDRCLSRDDCPGGDCCFAGDCGSQ